MAETISPPAPRHKSDDGRPYREGGRDRSPARRAPRKITGSVANGLGSELDGEAQTRHIERETYALRASSRRLSRNHRTRGCGVRCVRGDGVDVEVRVDAKGRRARWMGVQRCEHRWTCPVCARRIVTQRRQQIVDAVTRGADVARGRRWQMVTLTLRHHAGMRLDDLIRGAQAAWRRTRQRGTVQRAWRANVRATVRALELTHGRNGWHPHLHVLMLASDWTTDEQQALADTWAEMVVRELGEACRPDVAHGVLWSRGVSETYLAKLGLELTGAAKDGTPFALVSEARDSYTLARSLRDPAAASEHRARGELAERLWQEFEAGTKGVRAIELDDRAADLARQGERVRLAEDGAAASGDVVSDVWFLEVSREALLALRAIERVDRAAMWNALRLVEQHTGPREAGLALDAYIRDALSVVDSRA